jgi:Co/Zn/Cd efflux system component
MEVMAILTVDWDTQSARIRTLSLLCQKRCQSHLIRQFNTRRELSKLNFKRLFQLLFSGNSEVNINVRAAFIHVIGDAIQSVGVLIAALLILYNVG